jgi:hypothetical protein
MEGPVSSIRVVLPVEGVLLLEAVDVPVVEVLPELLTGGEDEDDELEAVLEADALVKSTMNVSIRVEQPNDVSAPSVPSQ